VSTASASRALLSASRAGRAALATGLVGLALAPSGILADTITTMHVFKGAHHGGVQPQGALLQASDGKLWGATHAGGDDNDGIIFKMALDGTYESVTGVPLWQGRGFVGDLVQTDDGTLWAVTSYGGDYDAGSILAVGLDGSVSLVYSFNPAGWGGHPNAGLLKASDGNLYGVIPDSGDLPGAVYRVQPETRTWSIVATLPEDCVYYDGGRLVEGSDGAFYGVRRGQAGCIFRVTTRGTAKVIHEYKGDRGPQDLVAGMDGNLYGTFWEFRNHKEMCAAVFRMTLAGKSTTVRHLPCPNGSAYPLPGIAQGADGMLHGSVEHRGNAHNNLYDAVWSMAPDGSNFTETRMRPRMGTGAWHPIQASDGAFYATAPGGRYDEGTIVRIEAP
jgi:hypothetical protein